MSEYLRRAALWATHFDADPFWPFGDIVGYVEPEFELDPDLAGDLDRVLKRPGIGTLTRRTARAAVRWAALSQTPPATWPELPAPYEPLVMMFERGGGFYEEEFIELEGPAIPRGTIESRAQQAPFALSVSRLDAIDVLHARGKRWFYLLPDNARVFGSRLIRRVSIAPDIAPKDAVLETDLQWCPTAALLDIEKSGSNLESLRITDNHAIDFVEKNLFSD